MKYNKTHTTYEEQVNLLISRGLIVNDKTAAEKILHHISYYRFSAYSIPYQSIKDTYDQGVTFETVLRLYRFDHELRMLCFDLLEHIEVAIRTQITYTFTQLFGPFGYTDAANFSHSFRHAEWFGKACEEMGRAKETFIQHYRTKYFESEYLPLWMATEVFSFGALSRLYCGMKRKDKRTISHLYAIDDDTFGNWLHVLVYLRNLCAHHARLWNRGLGIHPSYPNGEEWRKIRGSVSHNRIFSVLVVISYLLKKHDSPFILKDCIKSLLEKYSEIRIEQMGFPTDWFSILSW